MTDHSPNHQVLVLKGVFEGFRPLQLFRMFTEPDLLIQWWPPTAEISAGEGGWYRLSWPESDWVLSGQYQIWDPGVHLRFTWRWNFDPADTPEMIVDLQFRREDNCTHLTIEQFPYSESEADQVARNGHREGWIHFCMRLAGLRVGDLLPGEEAETPAS